MSSIAALVLAATGAACVVPEIELEGYPCECGPGYLCDRATDRCVRAFDAWIPEHDAGSTDVAVPEPDAAEPDAGPPGPDGTEPICEEPFVLYCENFENRPLGPVDAELWSPQFKAGASWYWSEMEHLSVVSGGGIEGGVAAEGDRALEFYYPAGAGGVGNGSNSMLAAADLAELWIRFYVRYSASFRVAPHRAAAPVELDYFNPEGDESANIAFMAFLDARPEPAITITSVAFGAGNYRANEPAIPVLVTDGRWHCVEAHHRVGSGGVGDVEAWIDGTQTIRFREEPIVWRIGPPIRMSALRFRGEWSCASPDGCPAHSAMRRWTDGIVVGTERIGCGTLPTDRAAR